MDKSIKQESIKPPIESSNSRVDLSQEIMQEIVKRPHIFVALVQNALTVAQSLRDNYFTDTAELVSQLRPKIVYKGDGSSPKEPIFKIEDIDKSKCWEDYRGEEIAFIDGGVGSVEFLSQVPMLLRVGTYKVKTGESILSEREKFGFYPVIFGDLMGGSKERKDYPDIVRIIAELLAVLHTLQRYPNLDILVLHGPLVYLMGQYAGHIPFTEEDIDIFLNNYGLGEELKREFQEEANRIYPHMTEQWRSASWIGRLEGHYEPICFIRFLLRKIISIATDEHRPKKTLVCGVTERGTLSEFTRKIVFQKMFDQDSNIFNKIFNRNDINSAEAAVKRLGYNDPLILSMLLQPAQSSEPFNIQKYENFDSAEVADVRLNYKIFRPESLFVFPKITGMYLQVSENTFPIRIEVFGGLPEEQAHEVLQRIYLYSTLLPGYAFPIGLDIIDKFAKVPNWLTSAYEKLIKYHIMAQLYQGQVTDEELRKIIIQALYTTQRDWLFRPSVR